MEGEMCDDGDGVDLMIDGERERISDALLAKIAAMREQASEFSDHGAGVLQALVEIEAFVSAGFRD